MDGRWAVFIGLVAGVLVPFAAVILDLQVRLDDPGGLIAVQFVGGLWGTIAAAGAVVDPRIGYFHHLGVQLMGLISVILLSLCLSVALFLTLKATMKLRPREADEFDGLDLSEHDIGTTPIFSRT